MKFAARGLVVAASLIASASAQCTSHVSCAELKDLHGGWPTARGSALVCGESDNGIALDADSDFTVSSCPFAQPAHHRVIPSAGSP